MVKGVYGRLPTMSTSINTFCLHVFVHVQVVFCIFTLAFIPIQRYTNKSIQYFCKSMVIVQKMDYNHVMENVSISKTCKSIQYSCTFVVLVQK